MDGKSRSRLFQYGGSIVAILLALAVRMLLDPYLGERYPIVTFLIPVILIAWYGGLGPSIVSIAGALLLANYFFLSPRYSLWIDSVEDRLGFVLYACAGLVMTLFTQAWRNAHRQTAASEEQSRQLVASLRESEQMLRMAEHAGHSGSFDWNLRTGRSRISPELSALYGVEPAELEGSYETWAQMVDSDDLDRITREFTTVLTRHEPQVHCEYRITRRDGQIRWIECRAKVTYDAHGEPSRVVGVNIDITERKEAERRLHEHTVQLQAITDHAHDFIARFDCNLRHLFVNRALAEAVHIPLEQYLGRTSEELGMPADKVALWNRHLRHVFETGQPESMEFDMETDGESRSFSSLIVPERASEQGAIETVLAITRDVTDAKLAEAALKTWNEELEARVAERTAAAEQSAARLRMLAAELTQAEQRERRHLAKILHDHLQQLLVAARMRISMLHRHAHNENVAATLQQIHELLDQCLTESRSLTVELSPPVLYEAGLGAGLQWLARQMEEKHHLRVDVEADPAAEPRCEAKRAFLFQAVRELLLNVVKHAQVDMARVELTPLDNDWLRLVVTDFGQGFELPQLEDRRQSSGFGLFSIRERLEVLGGRLRIDSAPGQGTRMVIEISRAATASAEREPVAETGLNVPAILHPPLARLTEKS